MATVSAEKYGNHTPFSEYGEPLLAQDGNGDMYGDETILLEGDRRVRIMDILALESEIMRSPLQEGDKKALELLEFDKIILVNGLESDESYESFVAAYPDLSDHIREVVADSPVAVEDIAEVLDEPEETVTKSLKEAPVAFIKQLAAEEADAILRVLLDESARLNLEQLSQSQNEGEAVLVG